METKDRELLASGAKSRWPGASLTHRAAVWHAAARDYDIVDRWDPLARALYVLCRSDWRVVVLFALIVYVAIEKFLVPWLGGYLHISGRIWDWNPHIEALLTGFEFSFFIAFYTWTNRSVADVFLSLDRNRVFADEVSYSSFLSRLRPTFDRPWPALTAIGVAVVAMIAAHFWLWAPDSAVPPWWGDRLYARVLALPLVGLVAYCITHVLIREYLVIRHLNGLWHDQGAHLIVHPYHVDGTGGFAEVGRHGIRFSYFVIVFALFFVMASLLPGLLKGTISVSFWSPLVVVMWSLYLVIVPTSLFLMLWPAHLAMKAVQTRRLTEIADQLDDRLTQAAGAAIADKAKIEGLLGEIEALKKLRNMIASDYPTSPIRRQITVATTSVVPFFYTAVTFVVDQGKTIDSLRDRLGV